jgi:hypothetical protein
MPGGWAGCGRWLVSSKRSWPLSADEVRAGASHVHALAVLELDRLVGGRGQGHWLRMRALAVRVGAGGVDRLVEIAELAVQATEGPLTEARLEMVRRLADAVGSTGRAAVAAVVGQLSGAAVGREVTDADLGRLVDLAGRAKQAKQAAGVGPLARADLTAQWNAEARVHAGRAGQLEQAVAAARGRVQAVLGRLPAPVQAEIAAASDRLARHAEELSAPLWLGGDQARLNALDVVRGELAAVATRAVQAAAAPGPAAAAGADPLAAYLAVAATALPPGTDGQARPRRLPRPPRHGRRAARPGHPGLATPASPAASTPLGARRGGRRSGWRSSTASRLPCLSSSGSWPKPRSAGPPGRRDHPGRDGAGQGRGHPEHVEARRG